MTQTINPNLMLQIKLSAAELHALFRIVEAKAVVGFPNALLFPKDEEKANALYQQGFDTLVDHGWLKPEGTKFNAHDELFLYMTMMVSPQSTVVAKQGFGQAQKAITYYQANGQYIEQYFGAENLFYVSPLQSFDQFEQRLTNFLDLEPVDNDQLVSFEVDEGEASAAIKAQDHGRLAELFGGGENNQAIVQSILNAKPYGQIEFGDIDPNGGATIRTVVLVQNPETKETFSFQRSGDQVIISVVAPQSILK